MSRDDPRHPSSSSSLRSDDETWQEFLRTAGGTVTDQRSISVDRKRRHTGSSPERRSYRYPTYAAGTIPRRPSAMSAATPTSGDSRETAIDLTSPPRSRVAMPPPQRPSAGETGTSRGSVRSSSSRRESDIVLPKWQPDSEVIRCPVCKTEFGFWNRRHHCRKCGRVVCAACSPHRITIPRQYIVQPPYMYETEFGLPRDEPESPLSRALGGGEVVRVCNPCVPDPWTPEAAPARGVETTDVPARPLADAARNVADVTPPQRPDRSDRYRYNPPAPPPPGPNGRNRSQSHQPAATILSQSLPQGHPGAGSHMRAPPMPSHASRPSSHRYTQSSTTAGTLPPIPSRPPIPTTPSAPPHPKPRREIREEDECPVCGTEMPAGEQLREAHVQECIASRFSSTPSQSTHQPRPSETGTPADNPDRPSASRPRATSYRPRGMALYKATEKDCMDEDGEAQECVICFEEFQPGDDMGRMECLCKFHRQCIRSWWETKGAGSCPTHQLHD